jgi:hypothetical protein
MDCTQSLSVLSGEANENSGKEHRTKREKQKTGGSK